MQPLVALALTLAAGASAAAPSQVVGTLAAPQQAVAGNGGPASPLVVRLYELSGASLFNRADFMALWQHDRAELGGDLVAREEFVLGPGEGKTFARTLAPATRFLGVVAAQGEPQQARWRSMVSVQPGQSIRLNLRGGVLAVESGVPGSPSRPSP